MSPVKWGKRHREGIESGYLELPDVSLPDKLPEDVEMLLHEICAPERVRQAYLHILNEVSSDHPVLHVAEQQMDRYVEEILESHEDRLDGIHLAAFRAKLALQWLDTLRVFRLQFAERGINPLFLQTWLQKLILANIVGLSPRELDARILGSGRKGPDYLREKIDDLLPRTCLRQ